MPGPKLKLGMPEVAAQIDERHRQEGDGWRKTRLLAVKLVARGESTSAEIADLCGPQPRPVIRVVEDVA